MHPRKQKNSEMCCRSVLSDRWPEVSGRAYGPTTSSTEVSCRSVLSAGWISTLFPRFFLALSILFQRSFLALSTLFALSFHAFSILFPRSFPAVSTLFRALSTLFPRTFHSRSSVEIAWKNCRRSMDGPAARALRMDGVGPSTSSTEVHGP